MRQFTWILLLFVVVSLRSAQNGVADAIGNTLGWLLVALIPTAVWWAIDRKRAQVAWRWFNWLNTMTAIMAVLVSLHALTAQWATSQSVKRPSSSNASPPLSSTSVAPTHDSKGWTEESTNSTEIGPCLDHDPPGTRYWRDYNNIIHRVYPPGVKPSAAPANPFGLDGSSENVPPPNPAGEG